MAESSGPYGPFRIPEDFEPEKYGWSVWQELAQDSTSWARARDAESGIQESLVTMRHPESGARGAMYQPTKDLGEVTLRDVWNVIGVDPNWKPDPQD